MGLNLWASQSNDSVLSYLCPAAATLDHLHACRSTIKCKNSAWVVPPDNNGDGGSCDDQCGCDKRNSPPPTTTTSTIQRLPPRPPPGIRSCRSNPLSIAATGVEWPPRQMADEAAPAATTTVLNSSSSSSGANAEDVSFQSALLYLTSSYGHQLSLSDSSHSKIKPPDILRRSSASAALDPMDDYNNNSILGQTNPHLDGTGAPSGKASAAISAKGSNPAASAHSLISNSSANSLVDNYKAHLANLTGSAAWGGNANNNNNQSDSSFLSTAAAMISPPPLSSHPSSQQLQMPSSKPSLASIAGGGGASVCSSISTSSSAAVGGCTSHQSMLASQLLANAISAAPGNPSNGSIPHKCGASSAPNGAVVSAAGGGALAVKKGENCMTHAMPNTLWCLKCHTLICRACAGSDEHRNHNVKTQAKEALRTEIATELLSMQKSLVEVQHLVLKQRDFLLKILDSCTALKGQIETELINHGPTLEVAEMRDSFCRAKLCLSMLDQSVAAAATANGNCGGGGGSVANGNSAGSPNGAGASPTPIELYKLYSNLAGEKQKLHNKYQDLYLQCKFDDLLRNSGHVIDYDTISRVMQTLQLGGHHAGDSGSPATGGGPLLLMANYCLTQIYARQSNASSSSGQSSTATLNNFLSSSSSLTSNAHSTAMGDHHQHAHATPFPFAGSLTSSTSVSNLASSPSSAAISIPQLSSSYGGSKSPFLDLAVGSPSSASGKSAAAFLHSSSMSQQQQQHMHQSMHFPQSQAHHSAAAASHLLGSSAFGHFNDNLLLSSQFHQSQHGANHHAHHHHGHGIASPLSSLRSAGSSGASGAGGISFEMNGISVPITMLSSQQLSSSVISAQQQHHHGGNASHQQLAHHHPHHHHLLHSAANGVAGLASVSSSSSNSSGSNSIICNPTVHIYPIYYFNIEINGQACGRILIEVRNDVAPRMAKNFGALASGDLGFGYKGCQIFQCWENESIITGDFELNNGRGGRSVFEEGFFMPDDTKILAIRGSVGMRRSQKRHDNMGLVGSQFRIILREMRGFTGIFAFVIEGLDLVEKISQTGDSAGKPQSNVLIVSCGKLQ